MARELKFFIGVELDCYYHLFEWGFHLTLESPLLCKTFCILLLLSIVVHTRRPQNDLEMDDFGRSHPSAANGGYGAVTTSTNVEEAPKAAKTREERERHGSKESSVDSPLSPPSRDSERQPLVSIQ